MGNYETTERTEVVMQVLPVHRFTATNHVTLVILVLFVTSVELVLLFH